MIEEIHENEGLIVAVIFILIMTALVFIDGNTLRIEFMRYMGMLG